MEDQAHVHLEADLWESYGKTSKDALASVRKCLSQAPPETPVLHQSQLYEVKERVNCSRRFVVYEPGFFKLQVDLDQSSSPTEEEESECDTLSDGTAEAASEADELDKDSHSSVPFTVSNAKRRSKRERLLRKVVALKGKQKWLRTNVRVTDVHHHAVPVVKTYSAHPSHEFFFDTLLTDLENTDMHTSVGDLEDPLILSKSRKKSGVACFLLQKSNLPAVVQLDFEANMKAVVKTDLFGSFSGLLAHREIDARPASCGPVSHTDGRSLFTSALSLDPEVSPTTARQLTSRRNSAPELPFGEWPHLEETSAPYEAQRRSSTLSVSPQPVVPEASIPQRNPHQPRPVPAAASRGARSASFHWYSKRFDSTATINEFESDEEEGDDEAVEQEEPVATKKHGLRQFPTEYRGEVGFVAPTSPAFALEQSESIQLLPLVTKGKWFYEYLGPGEPLGRAVLLRGVNLSGATKLPAGSEHRTHLKIDWGRLKDPRAAAALSFVGRPFPIEEAPEHLTRLRRWGFNCFRFLVTWEAIEHAGPGLYDTEYLDYVEAVVRLAGQYGFYVFIDPHQDVWSRMSGGSGAPAWTFTAAGLDLSNLEASEAAFTHNSSPDPAKFQRMSWPQNYQRFAALHMFTLFWGGNHFAPYYSVDGGMPIQEFLQRHFINAILEVAKRVKDMPHVIGFDSFNEPSPGFIGKKLDEYPDPIIPPGPVFKPFDAMCTASGFDRVISRANGIGLLTGKYRANPNRVSVWSTGVPDIWRVHGVWDVIQVQLEDGSTRYEPRLLQPNYFRRFPKAGASDDLQFFRDYLRPFMVFYISKIRTIMPRAILFAEGDGFGEREFIWDEMDPPGVVNASHWYDGYTLFTSNFSPNFSVDVSSKMPVFGRSRIYGMHLRDLKGIAQLPQTLDGKKIEVPTLIGEFGIPFNMNSKYGFKTGDFRMHERAMSLYYDLMDALQLHSTQWNYCADNSNDWGDNWNLEDLSLFSRDQQTLPFHVDINSGGRGVTGFCRPYAPFVCGVPKFTVFNRRTQVFEHAYEPNARNFQHGDMSTATEIFVPDIQYLSPRSASIVQFEVVVEGGRYVRKQFPGRHVIYVWADHATFTVNRSVLVQIKPKV